MQWKNSLRSVFVMHCNSFSLYVHWPFCTIKCPYCDFNSYKKTNIDSDEWLKGYLKSIDAWASLYSQNKNIKSIFFGGGTPSIMNSEIVMKILERVWRYWSPTENCEISIEANPNSVCKNKLRYLKEFGVNRVSVGIQAFNDKDLKQLGRDHTCLDSLKAIETVQNIFSNFNLDFIYGRQFQSINEWEQELSEILAIGAPHLSLYQLTLEEKTSFYKLWEKGHLKGMPDEKLSSELYFLTGNLCSKNNYINYETSNYSKENYFCQHNLSYWKYEDFLGIGPGAHGRLTINKKIHASIEIYNPDKWLQSYLYKERPLPNLSPLSEKTVFEEKLIMNMRISKNIPISWFNEKKLEIKLYNLQKYNLLKKENGHLVLKKKGKLMLNHISSELLECF